MKQIGVFMTLPFVLAAPPVLGWFFGSWLDEKFDTAPYLMFTFIALGLIAGFREMFRIVKRFGDGS